jgi:hypothetical protein
MSKIKVDREIQNLNNLCEKSKLQIIIFSFSYIDVNFRCVYVYKEDVIVLAAENYNISFKLNIKSSILDNYLPDEIYQLLKIIYLEQLETRVFCDNMLQAIGRLKIADVKFNLKSYCKGSNNRNLNDGEIFKCWARNRVRSVSKKNILKTKENFEEGIYLICKEYNISSRWKDKSKSKE